MKTGMRITVLMLVPFIFCSYSCSHKISADKERKIADFISKTVSETLEADYRSHHIAVQVVVTDVTLDRLTRKETEQDAVYAARGRVSYIIKGKRTWKDADGNTIELGPEQEVSHWFTCGVLEDRYLGELFKDDRNKLSFFAEKPA